MSLKGIIAISGMPGLYKVLTQTKSGFIVESLADKKRMPVSSTQRISMLEDISVFTTADDLPLKEVMLKLIELEEKKQLIDPKSEPGELREFFRKVVPDFDTERVYPSDIKKILIWFQLVKEIVLIEDEPEAKADEKDEASEPAAEEKENKKPVKEKEAKKKEKSAAPKKKVKTEAAEAEDKKDKAPAKARKKPTSK